MGRPPRRRRGREHQSGAVGPDPAQWSLQVSKMWQINPENINAAIRGKNKKATIKEGGK
jgi:hypothetical protein